MRSAKFRNILFPAAIAAATLLGLPAAAEGPDLSTLEVAAKPTMVKISLTEKAPAQVRSEIHRAARTVCTNAIFLSQLDIGDYGWCRDGAETKARKTYARLLSTGAIAAGPATITLSAY